MSFEKIKKELYNAGKVVTENASVATSIASAKLRLKEKNDLLTKEYAVIGKKAYEASKSKTKDEYKNINELLKEIEKIEKEISELDNTKVCSKCGSKEDKSNQFCSKCGAKI